MPDNASSGGGKPMASTSSNKVLFSLGHTINFIDNGLQLFQVNYESRTTMYKTKMSDIFRKIPK